jgi:hypothetical protein
VAGPIAPYFRFPALRHPAELVTYLGQRNIGIFSTDLDSFDFKLRKPEQVRQAVMTKGSNRRSRGVLDGQRKPPGGQASGDSKILSAPISNVVQY